MFRANNVSCIKAMTCVCSIMMFKKQIAAVIQLKINNYISATRIPFFTYWQPEILYMGVH